MKQLSEFHQTLMKDTNRLTANEEKIKQKLNIPATNIRVIVKQQERIVFYTKKDIPIQRKEVVAENHYFQGAALTKEHPI